jgi:hypothetical protein
VILQVASSFWRQTALVYNSAAPDIEGQVREQSIVSEAIRPESGDVVWRSITHPGHPPGVTVDIQSQKSCSHGKASQGTEVLIKGAIITLLELLLELAVD